VALACNIDQRGRQVRYRAGAALSFGALLAYLLWARPSGGTLAWACCALLLLGGLFTLFEASRGWCAVRALGFKTRI
jgi:hypothetical protein